MHKKCILLIALVMPFSLVQALPCKFVPRVEKITKENDLRYIRVQLKAQRRRIDWYLNRHNDAMLLLTVAQEINSNDPKNAR